MDLKPNDDNFEREEIIENPKKGLLGVLVIIVLTSVIIFGLTMYFESNKNKFEREIFNSQDRGVLSWVSNFTNKDYKSCDDIVLNSNHMICPYNLTYHVKNPEYYYEMLDNLVDCIDYVKVLSVKQEDDKISVYTLEVSFKPYKRIENLEFNDDKFLETRKGFIQGTINNSEFQSELERVYFDVFDSNCFNESDEEEIRTKVLTLSEKEVNGVTCVYNTVSFIDELLSDSNIINNVLVYQNQIKSDVSDLIEAE